ncbi:MAG: hypothetical protein ACYTG0_12775 [Planctomycetota bacterium]|jgi:hypothetical protein
MPIELAGSNLVVTAHHFNPSIFSQLWLARNGVLGEDEFSPGCLFSDQVANVESLGFGLLVVPPQMQFVPRVSPDCQGDLVRDKVGTIVRALPHTPYTAIGLNFLWHAVPEDGDVAALTRVLFFTPDRGICQLFDADDARFGAYFSRDALGCRLKLDVKPISRQREDGRRELVQFAFNFHLDVPRDENQVIAAIERHLGIWDEARAEATRIVEEAAI